MGIAPQNPPVQTPNFVGGGVAQTPQMQQPMGKSQKPVTHGLVSAQDIDERIASMPREAQQAIVKAAANIPDLPTIFGIAIGPEAHDYFAQISQAVQQQQQNSQGGQGGPSSPTASQNPPAPAQGGTAGGQPPAMATPAVQQGQ